MTRTTRAAIAVAVAALMAAAPTASAGAAGASRGPLVSVRGTLLVLADAEPAGHHDHGHEDHHADDHNADHYGADPAVLETTDGTLVGVEADAVDDVASGAQVDLRVPGRDAEQVVAAAAASGDALEPTSVTVTGQPTAAAAAASHQVTVVVAGIDGKATTAYTDAVVDGLLAKTSSYWFDQSGGAITFSRTGPVTRYDTTVACANASGVWNEAATKSGFASGANKHLLVLTPRAAYDSGACGYGIATVAPSVSQGGRAMVSDVSWPALAHELGHNLSMNHADRLECPTPASDAPWLAPAQPFGNAGCYEGDYGDAIDVMAANNTTTTGNISGYNTYKLGSLATGERLDIGASTAVTPVTIHPLGDYAGLRSVKVVDPRSSLDYYLEVRAGSGRDGEHGWGGDTSMTYGLRIQRTGHSTGGQLSTVLLDPTPHSPYAYDNDAVLANGTTFANAGDGIEIRTMPTNVDGSVTAYVSVAATGASHWPNGDPTISTPTPTPSPIPTPTPTSRACPVDLRWW